MRGDGEMAKMDLTVGAEDVDGLVLITAPGAKASGVVVSDSGEPLDFRAQQMQIAARPAVPDAPQLGGGPGGNGRVLDNWTFELANLTDARLIRAQRAPGVDAQVGVPERPGHHRRADGISAGPNGDRTAGRALEEDHRALGPGHRQGQARARRHRRGVPEPTRSCGRFNPASSRRPAPTRTASIRSRHCPRAATTSWWRCRASKTARPATRSFSRRSRTWARSSHSETAKPRRLTLSWPLSSSVNSSSRSGSVKLSTRPLR